ncbi:MAG: UDP-N-acetylmuramate:L-alanyl-gamma-D-glutamyl-meso-diaminopimelate ligase [Desulfosarcinaceae bacterium]|nr:UDP-N-acetylmuramate:L-alanyl-gamma-D-glutamyl-meso-diaminopimelate ligase [Desulfosarcinaceae bacterium]
MTAPGANNRIPESVATIHLTAICGTAMGALACALKEMGYQVTGSDQKVYPPMSDYLRDRGIDITEGYRAANLAHAPDLVVVGNAISRDNPEVQGMYAAKLAYCSMPQAVNHFIGGDKSQLLITGTHGKTTTASLLTWLLYTAQQDPTFMIGGILPDFQSNYRLGNGGHIVIEGDEYDTAFFDKGPKFLHYRPRIAVLTSVEFDHADIYRDLDHVKSAFCELLRGLDSDTLLLAADDDPNIDAVLPSAQCRVARYGFGETSPWRIAQPAIEPPYTAFSVIHNDVDCGRFRTRLMGRHNLSNLLAAIAAAMELGVSPDPLIAGAETFSGVRRRQEVRGIVRDITVLDDFAHHPTAVRETVAAVKPFYPDTRLIAVFEPRTNTSMRDIFQDVYPTVFDGADLICIRKPPLLSKIPEGQHFSATQLVEDLNMRGKNAHYFETTDAIIDFVAAEAAPGDAILIMSNGGFDNIHARLLTQLNR